MEEKEEDARGNGVNRKTGMKTSRGRKKEGRDWVTKDERFRIELLQVN